MDLERYPEMKAAGSVSLQALGNKVVVISKHYDSDLGVELDDVILPVDTVSLEKQKADLEVKLAAITMFLNDVAAVNP